MNFISSDLSFLMVLTNILPSKKYEGFKENARVFRGILILGNLRLPGLSIKKTLVRSEITIRWELLKTKHLHKR